MIVRYLSVDVVMLVDVVMIVVGMLIVGMLVVVMCWFGVVCVVNECLLCV